MTNNQSDYLDMFKAVIQFDTDTALITALRPAFGVGITDLKLVVKEIDIASGKQSTATSGTFIDRNENKEALCQQLVIVMSGTKAYAASISDSTLEEEMNYPVSELRRIKDESIAAFATNIENLVTPHLASLAPFGVDAAAMTALTTAKTDFETSLSLPRMAVTAKASQTEALPPLFLKGKNICRKILDPIALTLKPTNPDWYNQYHNVRKIINTGKGTTSLDGVVIDQVTNNPLYNVAVKVIELNSTIHSKVDGSYEYSPIPRGTYTVSYTLVGYDVFTLSAFDIKQGQNITKNVSLKPTP
jgi:hypothetical protein